MQFELAPMEGVTTWIYRAAYHRHFAPAVRYFTPFIAPNMNKGLNTRERNDVLPEHNEGQALIPQILTNRADYFLTTCRDLAELGYDEVNLNLGCPSGTVVSKGKGSGFLANPEELERFLDEIFEACPLKISIKTRVGRTDVTEWPRLLELYRRDPCTELIIHPRIQKDFYRGTPRMEAFEPALEHAPWPCGRQWRSVHPLRSGDIPDKIPPARHRHDRPGHSLQPMAHGRHAGQGGAGAVPCGAV